MTDTAAQPAPTGRAARLRSSANREQLLLLAGIPVLVLVVLGGWVAWRLTADLDDIEARQLAWDAIGRLTWQHVRLTVVATVLVLLIAVPLGIMLTRRGFSRAAPLVVGVANIGQAAPAIGLVVLFAIWLGFDFWTAIVAFTLYGILPVLRNTIVGLQGVDATLVEAGRGMGMSAAEVLWRIELPLAVPVIMAGVRTALVLVVGVASFATFIDAGGLGALIQTGITLFRTSVLVSGGLLIALLALVVDWLGRVLETAVRPKGL
ncbi:ABC transporter permease [Nocardioides caldifontis]|uniref:ABC transporter permease n=1 Tax=Nocardioides caldifontis TaxID=2588938 RepID=UPI0011E04248|nr:ABC transporter permease [Nocardioides caldifontis]